MQKACGYKSLKTSKIAWGGLIVAVLGAIQLIMASADLTQLQNVETAFPAAITMATGLAIAIWRQRTTFLIE